MNIDIDELKNLITTSQDCQRNWDLTKEIPQKHLDLFVHAVTQCPSKQNIAHYSVKFITNRNIIEQLHENTWTPGDQWKRTNPQILANLVVLFQLKKLDKINDSLKEEIKIDENISRNIYDHEFNKNNGFDAIETYHRDSITSIGIASSYLALTANMLGYKTGFCACFDSSPIKQILNDQDAPVLFLGIGHPDVKRKRTLHHITDIEIMSKPKQNINYEFIK